MQRFEVCLSSFLAFDHDPPLRNFSIGGADLNQAIAWGKPLATWQKAQLGESPPELP
jgi:hypothetical protein